MTHIFHLHYFTNDGPKVICIKGDVVGRKVTLCGLQDIPAGQTCHADHTKKFVEAWFRGRSDYRNMYGNTCEKCEGCWDRYALYELAGTELE